MANNGDLGLIATLDESSSEAEILKGIKKLNRILKANTNAKIKLDADIDINGRAKKQIYNGSFDILFFKHARLALQVYLKMAGDG